MSNLSVLLDAVSPIVLAIPFIILLVVIAIAAYGILWLIAYIKKRKTNK